MSEDDISKQPGPPEDIPAGGRGRNEMERNGPPFEDVKEKFEEITQESRGEGRFVARVIDSDGNEKDRLENRRVEGPGSVEIRPFKENGKTKWASRRRDKLGYSNDGGD